MTALERAIQSAGSARKLGAMIGVSGMAVCSWKSNYCGGAPAGRILSIYHATGVTPHELRPDLYPNSTDGLPQQQNNESA